MAFMEIVTGDGKTVTKKVISATEMQAFGTKKLSIPFDAAGKKWVRFSMWDVAGNGGLHTAAVADGHWYNELTRKTKNE